MIKIEAARYGGTCYLEGQDTWLMVDRSANKYERKI
jgi:hypothetical protein